MQGLLAHAEKACKLGIAPTKYGVASFSGPAAGITEKAAFWPRKPYTPVSETSQSWIIQSVGILEKTERGLPDRQ
jgi:2-keto-3-deoxy-L-rhamnonate aldolase